MAVAGDQRANTRHQSDRRLPVLVAEDLGHFTCENGEDLQCGRQIREQDGERHQHADR